MTIRLPTLVATSVVRDSQQGESHEKREVVQHIDWNRSDIDFEGLDVIEDSLDNVWLSDGRDDTPPSTAFWTCLNLYLENPLEWYVTRGSAPGKGARGISVSGAWPGLVVGLSLFPLWCALGVGTTSVRYLALGASTPWYRVSW